MSLMINDVFRQILQRMRLQDQIKTLYRDYVYAGAEMVSYVFTINSKIFFLILGETSFRLQKLITRFHSCWQKISKSRITRSRFYECCMGHY